jgi:hypothetical protein
MIKTMFFQAISPPRIKITDMSRENSPPKDFYISVSNLYLISTIIKVMSIRKIFLLSKQQKLVIDTN